MFLSININQNYIYVSRIIELQHDTSYCINLTNNYLTSLEWICGKLLLFYRWKWKSECIYDFYLVSEILKNISMFNLNSW